LPLIDLRHALDAIYHQGLSADGVHPSVHPRGGAILTDEGLRCGYNVRNYVTLRMLKHIRDRVLRPTYEDTAYEDTAYEDAADEDSDARSYR
jgi:hypothetical protein